MFCRSVALVDGEASKRKILTRGTAQAGVIVGREAFKDVRFICLNFMIKSTHAQLFIGPPVNQPY